MAREMREEDRAVWRAVITTIYETHPARRAAGEYERREYKRVVGPYRSKGAASAALTAAKREAEHASQWWGATEVTGHVERGDIVWTRLDS